MTDLANNFKDLYFEAKSEVKTSYTYEQIYAIMSMARYGVEPDDRFTEEEKEIYEMFRSFRIYMRIHDGEFTYNSRNDM